MLDYAIGQKKQVEFNYINYGIDKKPHIRKDTDGKPKIYTVSPYYMVAANGRHYLICTWEPKGNISHLRLDRIVNIKITDVNAKSERSVKELGNNLPKYLAERIYMFVGEKISAEFLIAETGINEVIDWFGTDVTIRRHADDKVCVKADVNENALFYWALQYGPAVEVIKPDSLRARLLAAAKEMVKKYSI
jgi:predicted DNA-binding transcriptional regulator YafY